MPAPDADLAAVGSASSAFMTPLPLLVLSIAYRLWLAHKKIKSNKNENKRALKDNDADEEKANHGSESDGDAVEMIAKTDIDDKVSKNTSAKENIKSKKEEREKMVANIGEGITLDR